MGATIRMTKDKRILIRNTAEVHNPLKMSKLDLEKRSINQKIGIKKIYSYVAPNYKPSNLIDKKLIKKINKIKPDYILTNIGGGTQEILGLYLKKNLKNKTTIICTGGAISFFTGDQAPITKFIDKNLIIFI